MKHFFKSLVVLVLMIPTILLDVVISLFSWPSKNWTLTDLLFDWLYEYDDNDV